jgi:hypothetical protein
MSFDENDPALLGRATSPFNNSITKGGESFEFKNFGEETCEEV